MWATAGNKIETLWTPTKKSPNNSSPQCRHKTTVTTEDEVEAEWISPRRNNNNNNNRDNDNNSNNKGDFNNNDEIESKQTNSTIHSTGTDTELLMHDNSSSNSSSRRRVNKLRQLVAALSFDHNNNHTPVVIEKIINIKNKTRKKNRNKNNKNNRVSKTATNKLATATTTTTTTENTTTTTASIITAATATDNNNSNQILCALRVNDSDGSDIYYDAEQFGDYGNDQFQSIRENPRESIVMAGIVIDDYETDIFETVLDNNNNGSTYSAHAGSSSSAASSSSYISSGDEEDDNTTGNTEHDDDETNNNNNKQMHLPPSPPKPPKELPLRFLRAGKNDPVVGLQRYKDTLQMRKEQKLDNILHEPNIHFDNIKKYYPHYCHLKGKNGEPCFIEQPPKTNLKALRDCGVTLELLLRHYIQITEYQWQMLERDDLQTSIYIIDLDGIKLSDFAGEAVDFVKKASAFSAKHYPERAGYVFVINVPVWFKIIWNVIKPIVDDDTLKKIYILRGIDEIRNAMKERIPIDNIPPEYGGNSMPLGESPEEQQLKELIHHNNTLANNNKHICDNYNTCKFCQFNIARAY